MRPSSSPVIGSGGPGTKPAVSARAIRRSCSNSSAVGDRAGGADAERGEPPQVVLAEAALDLVSRAEHAEQPPAEHDRHVHERADPLGLDHPAHEPFLVLRIGHVGLPGGRHAAEHALAEPEAGAGEALADVAAGDVAQLALAGVVAGQQHGRGAGQLGRLLDDRAVDGVEVDRGGHRLQRAVEQPLLAPQTRLALEQLRALERQRGEPREHLDRAQVLGVERSQRRVGGDRQHAERAAAGGAHRRGDERGGRVEVPRQLGELVVEVLAPGGRAGPRRRATR